MGPTVVSETSSTNLTYTPRKNPKTKISVFNAFFSEIEGFERFLFSARFISLKDREFINRGLPSVTALTYGNRVRSNTAAGAFSFRALVF
jgi:hypothetical protein